MIAQYTAAAIVSENKVLAHPASVDSIPTSANQEDHVSMGTISARKARTIMHNLRRVLAIELLCAAQGLDMRCGVIDSVPDIGHVSKGSGKFTPGSDTEHGMKAGLGVEAAYRFVRNHIPFLEEDREMHLDMAKAEEIIASGELLTVVENAIGPLE